MPDPAPVGGPAHANAHANTSNKCGQQWGRSWKSLRGSDARGVSSVVGVVLLVGLSVIAAATLGAVLAVEEPSVVPSARLTLAADAESDRIALTHEGGDTLHVERLDVSIRIDGEPLASQPPVPFFAAHGFRAGPTGPFNRASDGTWAAGKTAAVRLAGTNDPALDAGDRVTVTVATDGGVIARLEATA